MNHEKYKELLQLYVYDEINDSEKINLENHLLECKDCHEELKSIKYIYTSIASNRPTQVCEKVLTDSRRILINKIYEQENKITLRERIIKLFEIFLFGGYKFALGGAATFAVGLLLGYFLFSGQPEFSNFVQVDQSFSNDQLMNEKVQVSNIRFDDPVSNNGEIEFKFDMVKPISYKGKITDEFTQKLLATALLTNDNPGVRIQSVNTIAAQSKDSFIPDVKIKNALITSLETDENPGVRRAAINTLMNFPLDQDIRDAFLFVLSNDDNSGIRVAAINGLSSLKKSGTSIDDEVIKVLRQHAENEDNNFVKIRAARLLEEVK